MSKPRASGVQEGGREEVDRTIFDQEHLRQYTGGDLGLERELINLFLSHLTPVRAQLDVARSAQDWKFAAHSLKGSARSIGAPQIAALADKLESIEFEGPQYSKAQVLDEFDAARAVFAAEVKKAIG